MNRYLLSLALLTWGAGASAALTAPPLARGAVGDDRVAWSWDRVEDALGYHVYPEPPLAGGGYVVVFSTGYLQDGLAPDATALIRVAAFDASGAGPLSEPASAARTLARPPVGTAVSQVRLTGVSLNWFSNANAPGALAVVERSTNAETYAPVARTADWRYSADDLGVCTTYFFRVRYRNSEDVLSAPDAAVSTRTLSPPAPAVPFLQAVSLEGGKVALSWGPAASPDLAGYRLYTDRGGAALDFSAPLAVLSSTTLRWEAGPFLSSASYRFAVRAATLCGLEQAPPGAQASAAVMQRLAGVRAAVAYPPAGARLAGDRIALFAKITAGGADQVRESRFEYRRLGAASWSAIIPAGLGQTNPSRTTPPLLHWNAGALEAGAYELRVVATDVLGRVDAAPAAVPVQLDALAPSLRGERAGAGRALAAAGIESGRGAVIRLAEEDGAYWAELTLDEGSRLPGLATAAQDSAYLPAAFGARAFGPSVTFSLPPPCSGAAGARLTLGYPDAGGDGVVDGAAQRADALKVAAYDPVAAAWTPLASSRDPAARTISAWVASGGTYGLAAAASDPGAARAYPNPYKPDSSSSGIIFDRLPDPARVDVYDAAGRRIRSLSASGPSGQVRWDVRDASGRDAPTGVYLAVIAGADGQMTTRKLLVVR